MNIIILGTSQIGQSLAANLATEAEDITLVDPDTTHLNELQERFDLRTVQGNYCHPSTLIKAGGYTANTIIAVTHNDEYNILACQIASILFATPHKIARIRSSDYLAHPQLFTNQQLAIDVFFSPELLISEQLYQLIAYTGAHQILNFDDGFFKMLAISPKKHGKLFNIHFKEWSQILPEKNWHCIGIFRHHQWITIHDDTTLQEEDLVYMLVLQEEITKVLTAFGHHSQNHYKNIMIGGGGSRGYYLAKLLEKNHHLKIIEQNQNRCEYLLQNLNQTIILFGNACDSKLLNNENIEDMDVFFALTDNDSDNLISCLEAKQLGAKQVIALINQSAYIDLIEDNMIKVDIAISPQQISVDSILSILYANYFTNIYTLHKNNGKIAEIIISGENSPHLIGQPITIIQNQKDIMVVAIIREHQLVLPDITTIIHHNDHIILFSMKKISVKSMRNFLKF